MNRRADEWNSKDNQLLPNVLKVRKNGAPIDLKKPYFSCNRPFFLLGSALLLLVVNCARQAMPPGGPEDRTPPKVVHTNPANGSTHASRTPRVTIEFSEPVNRETVPEALFLAPKPPTPPKLKWKGNRLIIIFPDSLLPNQTYLLALGTGIRDRHGNPLQQTVLLAFSTGAHLDNGRIVGQVFGQGSLLSVQLWGYQLRLNPEPDPRKDVPQYVTQCSADGKFAFGYLSAGQYRLFAISDKDKNEQYNPGYDAIGFPPRDAHISRKDSTDGPLFFRLAVQDTLPPKILSARAPDNCHVTIRFSEPIDSLDASNPTHFSLTTGGQHLPIRSAYRSAANPSRVVLCTAKQDSSAKYTLQIQNVHDRAGVLLDSTHSSVSFMGNASPDTIAPHLLRVFPRDSSRTVLPDVKISCIFSEAMDTSSSKISLFSAAGEAVTGTAFWIQPDYFVWKPQTILIGKSPFYLKVLSGKLSDQQGNPFAGDSILTTFHVVSLDTLTEISGQVNDSDSTARGPVIIQATEMTPPKIKKKKILPAPGPYHFPYLLPGPYQLFAFRDTDKNGKLSPGTLMPFHFAERFIVYPDTVAARARWPNEGNNLTLPK